MCVCVCVRDCQCVCQAVLTPSQSNAKTMASPLSQGKAQTMVLALTTNANSRAHELLPEIGHGRNKHRPLHVVGVLFLRFHGVCVFPKEKMTKMGNPFPSKRRSRIAMSINKYLYLVRLGSGRRIMLCCRPRVLKPPFSS